MESSTRTMYSGELSKDSLVKHSLVKGLSKEHSVTTMQ